jgi:hypothetical protein
LRLREVIVSDAEQVHLDPCSDKGNYRVHVHWNARRCVECDGGPHDIDVVLRDIASL